MRSERGERGPSPTLEWHPHGGRVDGDDPELGLWCQRQLEEQRVLARHLWVVGLQESAERIGNLEGAGVREVEAEALAPIEHRMKLASGEIEPQSHRALPHANGVFRGEQ